MKIQKIRFSPLPFRQCTVLSTASAAACEAAAGVSAAVPPMPIFPPAGSFPHQQQQRNRHTPDNRPPAVRSPANCSPERHAKMPPDNGASPYKSLIISCCLLLMATPHKERLATLHAICLQISRHISQKCS